jgi:hypothetical protein
MMSDVVSPLSRREQYLVFPLVDRSTHFSAVIIGVSNSYTFRYSEMGIQFSSRSFANSQQLVFLLQHSSPSTIIGR